MEIHKQTCILIFNIHFYVLTKIYPKELSIYIVHSILKKIG